MSMLLLQLNFPTVINKVNLNLMIIKQPARLRNFVFSTAYKVH